jgi:hypothetical protein
VKFTLIYDGDLPSAGNKSKPIEASRIRNEFHDQLADLWDSHVILRQLARTARVYRNPESVFMGRPEAPGKVPDFADAVRPHNPTHEVDLCEAIQVSNIGGFIPLVRSSLYLACAVDVLFL